MALPAAIAGSLARLAPILAKGAKAGGWVGLGTRADVGKFIGQEFLKYGVLHPTFRAVGLGGKPHAVPPAAPAPMPGQGFASLQEQVLYGTPRRGGLFGSELGVLGGRRAVPGLLEKQMRANSK